MDLKDCFFTIFLHPDDCPHFAFSVPSINNEGPMERYHWVVLPQGMKNSPTICQFVVYSALKPVKTQFPTLLFYHYMDDILIAAPDEFQLQSAFAEVKLAMERYGLRIAPEKPYALIGQWDEKEQQLLVLEWIFLPHSFSRTVTTLLEMFVRLISTGRLRCQQLRGTDPDFIHMYITKEDFTVMLRESLSLQAAFAEYLGKILYTLPKHGLLNSLKDVPLQPLFLQQSLPIPNA
ncbi:PREDICTED: endogenous retrovirus group K member 18 Pol protein-like [Calidris pugnax]|uniref:endogenous retrovirus group K member 18 Pol protein-like n=1 Tax=Calidris pugnax TaxID=198806 RepID=UPI00071D0405|nr:PREDICTED: endogenous retrovirus group K member 18 Pol protein-like [Calidris pugnax]